MTPGARVMGPAIIIDSNATTVVEPGWAAEVTAHNHVVLTRVMPRPGQAEVSTEVDPVMLEVFNNLFMSIAEQMGVALQNTSYSVNIKERLDFSCAIFDAEGDLVANAPHIPVHLGAMPFAAKGILARFPLDDWQPGDVVLSNDPYCGGSHLPDMTMLTPKDF